MLRALLLGLSKSPSAGGLARRYGLRFGAQRFVAGETIATALEQVQLLSASGLKVTLDHLGEFVAGESEARESKDHCLKTLDAFAQAGTQMNLSVKLTQLGLDISSGLCAENVREILHRAREYGVFVRIDMEDSAHTQQTIDLVTALHDDFANMGTVIQAYLYRSAQDVELLSRQRVPLRIVKGAYKEPKEVAYPVKADVDENYKRLVQMSLEAGNHTAIATHDEALIRWTQQFVKDHRFGNDQFEFQMLYGIGTSLQLELVRLGYAVRVYVPFGTDWYGYFMRRLAERPANLAFVLKNLRS